jgi:hypothetical protein
MHRKAMLNLNKFGYDRATVGRWMYTGRPEMPGNTVEFVRLQIIDCEYSILSKP